MNNCSDFLKRTIGLIEPKVIVTLGSVALEALKAIEVHDLTIRENVAGVFDWNYHRLIPFYHPSPQVIASHRRLEQQLEDYKVLERELNKS